MLTTIRSPLIIVLINYILAVLEPWSKYNAPFSPGCIEMKNNTVASTYLVQSAEGIITSQSRVARKVYRKYIWFQRFNNACKLFWQKLHTKSSSFSTYTLSICQRWWLPQRISSVKVQALVLFFILEHQQPPLLLLLLSQYTGPFWQWNWLPAHFNRLWLPLPPLLADPRMDWPFRQNYIVGEEFKWMMDGQLCWRFGSLS